MTTHSLILHPHEVRAALAGTLGLAVRPVRVPEKRKGEHPCLCHYSPTMWGWGDEYNNCTCAPVACPLGVPGTRLVCKETWQEFFDDEIPPERTRAIRGRMGVPARPDRLSYVAYRADGEMPPHPEHGKAVWRSPATMPAWASRITLEVVGVRCVRVDRLYESEAERTGIGPELVPPDGGGSPHKEGLRTFWESKYAPRYPWETSWAWAVGVRRVEG